MTHLSRFLLLSFAAIGLFVSACQADVSVNAEHKPVAALSEDVSKDELIEIMQDAMRRAKSTSGTGAPVLWKFSDIDTSVYLYGTVHLLKPEIQWRSSTLDDVLSKADTLVLEADVTSPESQVKMPELISRYGMFPEGETLTSTLDSDDFAAVSNAIKANGLQIEAVNKVKPWLIGLQLGMMNIVNSGYDPQSGVEMRLIAQAKKGDTTFAFLETPETQLKAISKGSIDDQVKGLLATLGSIEIGVEYIDVLVAEWADGDVGGIAEMMSNPAIFGTQNAYDDLLTDRNKNWVPILTGLLDEPGTKLVAVGAAHLAGADSLQTMLAKEGVKVEVVN